VPRALRVALVTLPWVLLLLALGFAGIGWWHFLDKDRVLWERALDDVQARAALAGPLRAGDADAAARAAERLAAQGDAACALIDEHAELAPEPLRARVAEAAATCARGPDAAADAPGG
jgi:hypothetical protein